MAFLDIDWVKKRTTILASAQRNDICEEIVLNRFLVILF
jgi:hypothetical protein